ncbi:MAG: hypothetical protein M1820_009850 [Bogoriella megaspora]|nr:MAG: hypothetical protein M1820_009850 [Bogoriella megaspora]
MDPATVFSLAAGVVQFISFATSLTKGVIEIREAGSLKEVRQLSEVTKSLQHWHSILISGAKEHDLDTTLTTTLEGCGEVASKMGCSLEELTAKTKGSGPLRSVELSIRTAWKASEREQMQKQLNDYRLEICTYLVVLLFSRGLNAEVQKSVNVPENFPRLPLEVPLVGSQLPSDQRHEWLPILKTAYEKIDQQTSQELAPRVLRILEETDPTTATAIGKAVLATIKFPDISRRHDVVQEAHAKTFEWIFDSPDRLQTNFSSFSEWLVSDQKLYWVTGKAGSGKSTLMKFILTGARYLDIARRWMPDKKMIFCSFYFWNAGAGLQISQEGLMRTLLHQCLSQEGSLIPQVAPQRWDTQRLFGQDNKAWEWAEMVACLHTFFNATEDTHSIFIFIDGLDEFTGDHNTLVDLVQTLSKWSHIKTCVSSRPWIVFEDAYKQKPSLRMERLTRPDIYTVVSDKFRANQGFLDLQQAEPDFAAELISNIAERASGIFLWVVLVTQELLTGLTRGDRLRDLEQRLLSLPTDLEKLFRKMLNFEDTQQFQKASRFIQLVQIPRAWKDFNDLTLLDFAFADEHEHRISMYPVGSLDINRRVGIANRMRRRLDDACKGLIEVQSVGSLPQNPVDYMHGNVKDHLLPQASIDYLHRTVKDYLLRDDVWLSILEATPENFNPSASWSQAFIMQLKVPLTTPEYLAAMHRCCFWIKNAELTGHPRCLTLLRELETTAKSRTAITSPPSSISDEDFLHFIISNQLAFYAEEKLCSRRMDPASLQELWCYALRPKLEIGDYTKRSMHGCRAEMAEVLLRHGANPEWRSPTNEKIWDSKEVDPAHAEEMELMLQKFQSQPRSWKTKSAKIWNRIRSK